MLGEVLAPLAPEFSGLAVSLLIIVGALVCIGLVAVINTFVRATVGGIAGVLSHVPGIGGVLSSPVNQVLHWMEHEFGAAEAALDGILSQYLHELGVLWQWLADEVRNNAHLLYTLSTVMLGSEAMKALDRTIGYVHRVVVRLDHVVGNAIADIQRIELEFEHAISSRIGGAVRTLTRPIYGELHGLERLTLPRIEAYGKAIEHAIPQSIAGVRAWARGLEDEYAALYHRIARLEARVGSTAIAGTVALALAGLGISWVRCRNWRRIGRGVCGLPDALIEGLFLGAVEAFLVTDLCYFARVVEAEAIALEPVLNELVNVQRFICLGGGASYPSGIVPADLRGAGGLASGIVPADLAA
jgi:hypothetical protein